jgi:hypothetical protein
MADPRRARLTITKNPPRHQRPRSTLCLSSTANSIKSKRPRELSIRTPAATLSISRPAFGSRMTSGRATSRSAFRLSMNSTVSNRSQAGASSAGSRSPSNRRPYAAGGRSDKARSRSQNRYRSCAAEVIFPLELALTTYEAVAAPRSGAAQPPEMSIPSYARQSTVCLDYARRVLRLPLHRG